MRFAWRRSLDAVSGIPTREIESTKSSGLRDGARKRLRILAIAPMAAHSSRSNRSSTKASGCAATILCGLNTAAGNPSD